MRKASVSYTHLDVYKRQPETLTIDYATNGMPDLGANQMYYSASVSGPIDTMPDTCLLYTSRCV